MEKQIFPLRRYWCGFHENGKQKWFIELNTGKVISQKDDTFSYWNKKMDEMEIKKHDKGSKANLLSTI